MKTKKQYAILRWTARTIGTLLVVFTLFMATGEMLDGYHRTGRISFETFNGLEIVTFIFWFLGLAGLIWAWWKEGAGGFFSLICLVIFLILVKSNPEAHFASLLLVFLFPSVLYILYWRLTKKAGHR